MKLRRVFCELCSLILPLNNVEAKAQLDQPAVNRARMINRSCSISTLMPTFLFGMRIHRAEYY